jgi:hypothetical protein
VGIFNPEILDAEKFKAGKHPPGTMKNFVFLASRFAWTPVG